MRPIQLHPISAPLGAALAVAVAVLGAAVPGRAAGAQETGERRLDGRSVEALLDVVDAIVTANPGYERTRVELRELDGQARRARLDELAARNASDPDIAAAIDAFLGTKARTIYFRRFRNVKPDHFRRAFHGLPYERVQTPGDIAAPLYELVTNRNRVRARLGRLVAGTDLERCRAAAQRWLPDGDYALPRIFVVYDGNAGSYTAEGRAFYNLWSGEGASDLDAEGGEGIIAHEIHHVFAARYLSEARRRNGRWEFDRIDEIVRKMVSEGAALHCNPPTGVKKALFEDPHTVAALVAELNGQVLALLDGKASEEQFRAWYRSTYHELPRRLLEEHARREAASDETADAFVLAQLPHRPDLVHALGWWMVSRISGEGERPDAVKSLLREPHTLFSRYDETVQSADPALRIDLRVLSVQTGE